MGMDIRDSQRIKEIRDNTAKMADAFTRIADALERLADRKTEPSNSEKPNNSTISKMEQVEDEPKLTAKCLNCANGGSYKCSKCDGEMYFKTEPQTER